MHLESVAQNSSLRNFPPGNALLIQTKLNRPQLPRDTVLRPRLHARLKESLEKRLTLISAPAGFGKTTLAAQWLEATSTAGAWISLDASDNDLERFIRYFLSALENLRPGVEREIQTLLSSPTLPPPRYLADAVLERLSQIPFPILLVLDDYHTIQQPEIHDFMTQIIQHLTRDVHLVVVTRKDPPWPVSLWSGRDWLCEIRGRDLSFSDGETGAFLKQCNQAEVSPVLLEILQQRTEGWIAAIQMAALYMGQSDHPEALVSGLSASDDLVVDFLMDEVIGSLGQELLDFLAVAAVFERFCVDLCDALPATNGTNSAKTSSAALVQQLKRENIFLVPMDRDGIWYRFHHLFQSLITSRLTQRLTPEQKRAVHQAAGDWFARQNLLEEAVTHMIAAENIPGAVGLLANNLHTILEQDWSRRTLARWLSLFPRETLEEDPVLLVAQGCCRMFHWDFQAMRHLADRAELQLTRMGVQADFPLWPQIHGYIHTLNSMYFYWNGNPEKALYHARGTMRNLGQEHGWAYHGAIIYLGVSLAAMGREKTALNVLSRALGTDCTRGSRYFGMLVAASMTIHFYRGNLETVHGLAHQVLEQHHRIPVTDFWLSHAYFFLGAVAYEQNRLDRAEFYFSKIEKLVYRLSTRIYHDGLLGLSLVALARRDSETARSHAEAAMAFAGEMNDLLSIQHSHAFHLRLDMEAEKKSPMLVFAQFSPAGNSFWLGLPNLIKAEYLIAHGNPREAMEIIDLAMAHADQYRNTRQRIQCAAVKVLVLKAVGQPIPALKLLMETLEQAQHLGFIRTFVDRGSAMHEMLMELGNSGHCREYVRDLLTAFPPSEAAQPPSSSPSPLPGSCPLSRRELDVLKCLARHLTYREISEQLFISHETVKSHAANIYRKLKVSGRGQAVEHALKYKYLPTDSD